MPTLHIEHAIVDFALWRTAFERFAGFRTQAGVRSHRLQRPVGDPHYIVIDLDFDTIPEAERFLEFLHTRSGHRLRTRPHSSERRRPGSSNPLPQWLAAASSPRCRHQRCGHRAGQGDKSLHPSRLAVRPDAPKGSARASRLVFPTWTAFGMSRPDPGCIAGDGVTTAARSYTSWASPS